jgi:hypothetical protein
VVVRFRSVATGGPAFDVEQEAEVLRMAYGQP